MKVNIAKSAGFCFGVERAVNLAYENCKKSKKLYTFGDVIHNKHVTSELFEKGVISREDTNEIEDGADVLIRAHGVCPSVYEKLEKKNCNIIDATCPFVTKIHNIVKEQSAKNGVIFIIGSEEHPEVIGIKGCGCDVFVFSTIAELVQFTVNNPKYTQKQVSVVAQTTINRKNFEKIEEFIKKEYTKVKIFDTICRATDFRQKEVLLLAESNDAMIVIGDRKSSNSKRLFEISKSVCENSFFIEDATEIDEMNLDFKSVGITAGASTPASIIKEVKDKMSNQELSFEELLEQSFKTLNTGEKVTGIVTGVAANEVQVDLGVKHSGYIMVSELSDDPTYNVFDNVRVGEEIETIVVRVNDVEGMIMLSKKRIDAQKGWDTVEDAQDSKEILEGIVAEENRGGVIVLVNGVRVFVPASQTGVAKGDALSSILKTKVKLRILEVNRQRRRVLGSIRSVLNDARKEAADKIWETVAAGQKFTGTVKSLTSYGAFVDIGGVDGMVHVSELSWNRIKNPADVLSVGQEVSVYVLSLDKENRKISLGYKDPEGNPWKVFEKSFAIDDVTTVKIIKLMPFGAFAEVVPGVDGLIHISQISEKRIAKPDEVLKVGDEVAAKIIEIDTEKQKVSLSVRQANDGYDSDDYDAE